jgi:hypothetical protein
MLRDWLDKKLQFFIDGARRYIARMEGVTASDKPEIDPQIAKYVAEDMSKMVQGAVREMESRPEN